MARVIGRNTVVGIGNGANVAPDYWIPVRDLDIEDKYDYKDNDSGYGNISESQDSQILRQWADGGYSGKVQDLSAGTELKGVFGQAPTSVQRASTGVYDHTFDLLNSNSHAQLSLTTKDSNANYRFGMATVNDYTLEGVLDDYLRRNISFITKHSATATDTAVYTNQNEFVPKHITVKLATAQSGLTAASAIKATAFTLNIHKNANGHWAFSGSNDPDSINNHQFVVDGSLTLYYEDNTYHDYVQNNTHMAMRLDMVNTDVAIGTTENPALRFDIWECVFKERSKSFDNNDILTQTVNFKALFNLAAGKTIQARLTNLYAGTLYA